MDTQQTSISADARVRRPDRFQVEMQFFAWDQMLAVDHRARIVWSFVESLDLSPLYAKIVVTRDTPGQTAIAPEILVAL